MALISFLIITYDITIHNESRKVGAYCDVVTGQERTVNLGGDFVTILMYLRSSLAVTTNPNNKNHTLKQRPKASSYIICNTLKQKLQVVLLLYNIHTLVPTQMRRLAMACWILVWHTFGHHFQTLIGLKPNPNSSMRIRVLLSKIRDKLK